MEVTLAILAMVCLIPTLIAGAISDYRTRTFPKEYWKYTAPIGGFFTFLCYMVMLSEGQLVLVAALVVQTFIIVTFCLFMGYRYGSGGDWRAMAYIAAISPRIAFATIVLSVVFGAIMAMVQLCRKDNLSIFEKSIPFAIPICLAYIVSLLAFCFIYL